MSRLFLRNYFQAGCCSIALMAALTISFSAAARAAVVNYYPGTGQLALDDSGVNYTPGLTVVDVYMTPAPSSGLVGITTVSSTWTATYLTANGATGGQWADSNVSSDVLNPAGIYTLANLPAGLSALSFGASYSHQGKTTSNGPGDTVGAVVFTTTAGGALLTDNVHIERAVPSENDWTGPVNGSWNSGGNWSLSHAASSSETASFITPSLAGTVTLDHNQSAGSLWFDSTSPYTIASGSGAYTLSLSNTANIWIDSGLHTISAPLVLSGSTTVGAEPSLSPGSIGVTLSGPVSGAGPLVMAGPCLLSLSNTNNTYSGGTLITGGTLIAAGSGSLGASGSVSVANATLDFSNSGSFAGTVSLTGAGPNTIQADAGTMILSGVIGGTGGLTKAGNGILALSNSANSYSGGTFITGGTLTVAGSGNLGSSGSVSIANATLDFSNSGGFAGTVSLTGTGPNSIQADTGTVTLSGVISGSGALTTTGNGILALGNSANSYNGGTVITGGTLTVAGSGSLGPSGSVSIANATLDFSNSGSFAGTVSLTGTGPNTIQTDTGTMTLSGAISGTGGLTTTGTGILALSNSANSYSGGTNVSAGTLQLQAAALSSSGAVSIASSASLDLNGFGAAVANLSGSGSVTNNKSSTTSMLTAAYVGGAASYSAVIQDGLGKVAVSVPAGGALTLANSANAYSGGTFINGGQLTLAADGDLGAIPQHPATNLTLGGGTLYAAASFALHPNRNVSLTSDSVFNVAPGQSLTVGGAVTGAGGLTLAGSGSLILEGANSYTGGTVVDSGVLTVLTAAALPEGGSLTVGAGGAFAFNPAATGGSMVGSRTENVAAVPEPGTLVLLSVGAVFVAAGAWRRRARSG